jgi:hypothetical protein
LNKVLNLTLKKSWFVLMLNGVKKEEYRKPSDWIKVRLENKSYDFVKFVNGYGRDKPFFICEYKGFNVSEDQQIMKFDGKQVNVEKGDYIIKFGRIVDYGNLCIINHTLKTNLSL